MAATGRPAGHEALPKLDSKLVSASASSEMDSNPDVDPKTVSHPRFNAGEIGNPPKVDPNLVS